MQPGKTGWPPAGLRAVRSTYQADDGARGREAGELMLYIIAEHPAASPLHLSGGLYLFMDALARTSAARLRDFYIQEAVNYIEQSYQRNLTVISANCSRKIRAVRPRSGVRRTEDAPAGRKK